MTTFSRQAESLSPAIEGLLAEAAGHPAVNHPYLKALAEGNFRNMKLILQDFASQYGHYSAWFPRYLTAAIDSLENTAHREKLLENLAEEKGQLHEEDLLALEKIGIQAAWVQGIPHPQLFRRFQLAIGADTEGPAGEAVIRWRESFLSLIHNGTEAEALGAIGPGTESVVKHIYRPIMQAIETYGEIAPEDRVFFPLHTEVDDEHGLVLLSIASELTSSNPESAADLGRGMHAALDLRSVFWDAMLERAKKLDAQ